MSTLQAKMATSDGKPERIGLLDVLEPILTSKSFLRALVLDPREADAAKRLSVFVLACKTTAKNCTATSNPMVPGADAHLACRARWHAQDAHTHDAHGHARPKPLCAP